MAARIAALAGLAAAGGPAGAETFFFAPSASQELNRIFRVERLTGEVTACQFALVDQNSVGVTLCFPPGEGAKSGEPGDYALLSSNHRLDAGIFRVDRRSGKVSVCYVRGDQEVVCTAPVK